MGYRHIGGWSALILYNTHVTAVRVIISTNFTSDLYFLAGDREKLELWINFAVLLGKAERCLDSF